MRPHALVLAFMGLWLLWPTPWLLPYMLELIGQDAGLARREWIPIAVWLSMLPIFLLGYVPEALKMRRILGDIAAGR
jgi:hypothetical protein